MLVPSCSVGAKPKVSVRVEFQSYRFFRRSVNLRLERTDSLRSNEKLHLANVILQNNRKDIIYSVSNVSLVYGKF